MNLDDVKTEMESVVEWLSGELAKFKVGRANTALVDDIKVEVYGSKMPLNQIATVSVVDATLLSIQVWDSSNTEAVVKAINSANLGLNPIVDGPLIRIPIPPISEERRTQLAKSLNTVGEDARIRIRQIRHDSLNTVKKLKEENAFGEDEQKTYEGSIQKLVDEYNSFIDVMIENKQKDVMTA